MWKIYLVGGGEGDEAVVDEVEDGVEDVAGEGGGAVAREGEEAEVPLAGGKKPGAEPPHQQELCGIAYTEAEEEFHRLASHLAVGAEYPGAVPQE